MKVWITKYALTVGIVQCEAEQISTGSIDIISGEYKGAWFYRGDWHNDRKSALAKAESEQTPLDKVTIQALREYKELRDLEEQGLLQRLPCKEGTKVYLVRKCLAPSCEKCRGYIIYKIRKGVVKFGLYKQPDMSNDYECGNQGFYVFFEESGILRPDIYYWHGTSNVIGNIFDNPDLLKGGDNP